MSTKDIIKKSILENFTADVAVGDVVLVLLITLVLALYIFAVYRICTRTGFYSKDFNKALVLLALITSGIVLAMQSNLVISLGMVGALSIVRFRNAVKDSMDLVFLFWSISIGIICGAGLHSVAVLLSVMVTIALVILEIVPEQKGAALLVVNCTDLDCMKTVCNIIKKYTKKCKIKSRNITKHGVDAVIEIKCREEETLLSELTVLEGVVNVSFVNHSGEVRV